MKIRDLIRRLQAFPDAVVLVNIPNPNLPGGMKFVIDNSPGAAGGGPVVPEVRIMPIVAVHHHGHSPEAVYTDAEVELFTPPWHTAVSESMAHMSVKDLLAPLDRFDGERQARIAVPTSLGHHRILSIVSVGFGNEEEGDLPVHITTERWQSPDQIIRADDPTLYARPAAAGAT